MSSGLALLLGITGYYLFFNYTKGPPIFTPSVLNPTELLSPQSSLPIPSIKLLTLNIAHGRNDGFHQLFQSKNTIKTHLENIFSALIAYHPDIIAIQEADGPSFWSGGFSHVQLMARRLKYYAIRGEHVKGAGLSYGTALLSRTPLKYVTSYSFPPHFPAFHKGFVIATTHWPANKQFEFDSISVHFDFISAKVRNEQADTLIQAISHRNRPIIIMGDFNCEWESASSAQNSSVVTYIARRLNLNAYKPDSKSMQTFPLYQTRIDWILISKEFSFIEYRVLPDKLSDHLGVMAKIELTNPLGLTRKNDRQ